MENEFRRSFLKCRNCGYMVTTLTQESKTVEICPSCEEMELDYAPQKDADGYLSDLEAEIKYIREQTQANA